LLERDTENNNDVLIFQLLLKHGADTGARNKDLATPLDLAPYYGKVLIAQVLLGHVNKLEGEYYPYNVVVV
jgi:ankyrin repeat protein